MAVSKKRMGRWMLALSLACGGVSLGGWTLTHPALAQQATTGSQVIGRADVARADGARADVSQVAVAEELKSKAFQALKDGKFDQTTTLLSQAAEVSKDPKLQQLAGWARTFEQQRQVFVAERAKEHDKAVTLTKTLAEKDKKIYAMEYAARAYLLADDKDGFRKEPWAVGLLGDARKLADEYEKKEQWLKALRLYSQLSAIEPESPEWKEHMKTATRRVRLLALYTPDELKKIQEADSKERDEVEALVREVRVNVFKEEVPEKKAEDKEEAEERDANRIDWRETLKGVRIDMLVDALMNARHNYYREVNYQKMLKGGLQGMRTILTTPALEKEFPGLSDEAKKAQLLGAVDAFLARVETVQPRDEADLLHEVLATLQLRNKATVKLPEEVFVSEFADGAFNALDPFSNIIWPSDWLEFQKMKDGEFSGVGIQIQTDEAGNLKVVSPLEDSPAYRAGIKPEWVITKIDGKGARWISLNQAVKKITGPAGSTVTLTIRDTNNAEKEYALKRETIKIDSIKGWIHKPGGGWDYMIDPDQKIGYLRMTNFTKTSSDDMDKAFEEMRKQGAKGFILDLRYNPGGLLNAATDVVDKFITKGTIVSTRPDREDSPNRPTSLEAKNTRDEVKEPLVVLVNQYSASASEIVSGALKDHKRAKIVGERTFGKGSVQMLYPLVDRQRPDSFLKLTTSHYYLPNGKCIHREEYSKEWGVDPDVTVEMTPEQMRAAIDARQEFDILRDAQNDPTPAKDEPVKEKAEAVEKAVEKAKKKDVLEVDPQLSAGLLMLRMQLAGAQL